MARRRMVTPDTYVDERLAKCSISARYLYIGVKPFCDDAGVHLRSALRVKMEVFPGDSLSVDDVDAMLQELIDAKLLGEYGVDGEQYLFVVDWLKEQRIDKPTYLYPSPPEMEQPGEIRRTVDEGSPSGGRTVDEGSTQEEKRSKNEVKGSEGK